MAVQRIQFRRGTAASWTLANPILASGEPGYETDTRKFKIGDGASTWSQLSYFSGGGTSDDTLLVHLAGAETITGLKNFTGGLQSGGHTVVTTQDVPTDGSAVTPSLRTLGTGANQAVAGNDSRVVNAAQDTAVVHITGNEAIAGTKTFNNPPVVPAGAFPESAVDNLTADLAAKEVKTSKDVANGYAGLDSNGLLKTTEFPALNLLPIPAADLSVGNVKVTNVGSPIAATDAANKSYVDSAAVGFSPKPNAVTLADTDQTLSGLRTINGHALVGAEIILLTAQTAASGNGLWSVASGAWTRPSSFATGSDAAHSLVSITAGTYQGSVWTETTASPTIVDTDDQAWQIFLAGLSISATAPLDLTGSVLSLPDGSVTAGKLVNGTLTDVQIAAANKDGTAGTASLRTLGTGAQQAMAGNDSRVVGSAVDTAVVHNTGSESISGIKTFLNAPVVPSSSFPETAVANLTTDLAAKAADAAVVHNTGNETIAGIKTFSFAPVVPGAAFPESAVANLTTDLAAKAIDSAVVHNTGTEVIAGIKTFSSAPVVPSNSFPETAITNLTTDLAAKATDSAVVHNTAAETIAGVKTFSSAPIVPTSSFPESAITNLVNDLTARELTANKDVANGYAGLDSGGKLKTTEMVRLDQIPIPTTSVSLNSQRITNLLNPTSAQDAMTKAFADGNYLNLYNGSPEPYATATVGAATFTPNLANGNRQELTTTGNPTINMPTVTAGVKSSFTLRLINNGTGGFGEPTWDAKVTWVGLKATRAQGANTWDMYYFETIDNTVWWGYHLTALFSHGANYDDWTKMTAPSSPAANNLRQYVDTTDTVMKIKDSAGEVHLQEIHVGTTAPTNTAIPWIDTT